MRLYKQLFFLVLITLFFFSQTVYAARLTGEEGIISAPVSKNRHKPGSKVTGPAPTVDSTARVDRNGRSGVKKTAAVSDKNKEPRYVTIDFDNVDITLFIKFISELTGRNFVVDNRVRGKVTIISPTKITVAEAYRVFQSVLEVHGYTTIKAGSITKIVPALDARSKDIETRIHEAGAKPEDKVVTQLIPLKYANPDELKKVLTPFISRNSVIVSYEPTNMLIVTDVLSNITRLIKIINVIDVPGTGEEITVLPLKYANAKTLATSLNAVFRTVVQAGRRMSAESSQVTIVPDERTNTLIVVASEIDTLKIKKLIGLLDREIPRGQGDIHVYYLQNANAEDLTKVLMALPTKNDQPGQKGTAPVLSKNIQIVADKSTNSLIIYAGKDDYAVLKNVIKKLDIPRRMVYIEALIMEVSMNKDFELGAQWQGGSIGDRSVGVFGGSNTGTSILPSVDSSGNVTMPTGFSLGVLGNTINIGGLTFPDIGAVIRAYENDSDIQILSTPQIMTMDNEEAQIKVVNNVPYITSRDMTTSGANIAYSNYQFKDVGVILDITPQINQEKFVRLKISQQVSQIASIDPVSDQPTTLERQAKTTVVIKDGQTVVIGGLIDENDNSSVYKVPVLGHIPLLGYLFRSKTKTVDKKNLYIFITPHIIENPGEAKKLYEDKKGNIDTIREGVIKLNNGGYRAKDMRLTNLGYRYLQLQEYDKALKYYSEALRINPKNAFALLNMGYIYQNRGEIKKAREMYEKLIALGSNERAYISTDPMEAGKKLTDIAKENLKKLKSNE